MSTEATEIIDQIAKQRDELIEICRHTQAMLGKALDQRDELREALEAARAIVALDILSNNSKLLDKIDAALAKVPK